MGLWMTTVMMLGQLMELKVLAALVSSVVDFQNEDVQLIGPWMSTVMMLGQLMELKVLAALVSSVVDLELLA